MVRFRVVTIFPRSLDSYLHASLLGRAMKRKLVAVTTHDLRDYTPSRHKKVDDRPFGGGPGMVLQVEPFHRAVKALSRGKKKRRVILFSTRGKKFTSRDARRLAHYEELILLCGRYEGVDERVARHIADEEISLGDYIVSGGELPALVLIEAVSRFLPGFLGTSESLEEAKGSYPVYSRPEVYYPERKKGRVWRVPRVLLSGNHKHIARHRRQDDH